MTAVRKLLFERINLNRNLIRIAHRGYAPENTILGFKNAIQRGCDVIECDLRLSVDNCPIVIHDRTIDRTTCGKGYVKYLSKSVLESHGVPSLLQMLQWLKTLKNEMFVAFEIKDLGDTKLNSILLCNTVDLIKSHQFTENSVIISFNTNIVKDAKSMCPEIVTGFIFGNEKTFFNNPFSLAKSINADIMWSNHLMIKPFLHKNKDNMPICIWTVNNKKYAQSLDSNIIGIVSDDLQKVFAKSN